MSAGTPAALVALLLLSAIAEADEAPIIVTINPEALVSAALAGSFPEPISCGSPAKISVRIINQGFVTASLQAELVGAVTSGGARIDFDPEPLKGLPEEVRQLSITLGRPGATDLTIAFGAHHGVPDLSGRDRVHFLLKCL